LVGLGLTPLSCLLLYTRFSPQERRLYIACLTFYLSTYVIGYSGFNNYSMRGLQLPAFVFFFLFAKYGVKMVTRRLFRYSFALLFCLAAFGTTLDYLYNWERASLLAIPVNDHVDRFAGEHFSRKSIDELTPWEVELLRLPRQSWLY
jgi:hypothetical protein